MTTLSAALATAAQTLRAANVPNAMTDARALLAHASGIAPGRLTLHLADPLATDVAARLNALIQRRAARVPVSHLIGYRLFWGRRFAVTADVLDPRPETETLIAAALDAPFASVLDLGTGSGAILLTLLAERPSSSGLGTDISAPALAVARANADALGLTARARLEQGSWFAPVAGRFDLITSNPPYIAAREMPGLSPEVRLHEPHIALTPGGDGLDAYRAIAAGAGAHLATGGRLILEIGPTQGQAVLALLARHRLMRARILPDLDGRDRVVVAEKP